MPSVTPPGSRIRKRRQVLRMTQAQLAVKLGVATSTVANWERGKHFPARYQGPLEEILGIDLDAADAPGPLADLLPAHDEWEQSVLADPDLPDRMKRDLVSASRAARAEYRARKARQSLRAQDRPA
jgi:transcriptional regulator with XRE-family HTH domain